MSDVLLVRYGTISEVARFRADGLTDAVRGSRVVVRTHRGLELGDVLERLRPGTAASDETPLALRVAEKEDLDDAERHRTECAVEFDAWSERIRQWNLELDLLDLERTLDGEKLVLYVLNDRGADCTKLALFAAAKGLGTIEVQPVGPDGVIAPEPAGGGCGSGGCGTGGCGH